MPIKYSDFKCPQCKEMIPGDKIAQHRREVHGCMKDLVVRNTTYSSDYQKSVAEQTQPKLADDEKKEDMWRKMIFSGFESNRKKH